MRRLRLSFGNTAGLAEALSDFGVQKVSRVRLRHNSSFVLQGSLEFDFELARLRNAASEHDTVALFLSNSSKFHDLMRKRVRPD